MLLVPPPPAHPPPPPSLARVVCASPSLTALAADGAAGWRDVATSLASRCWEDGGVLDVGAGGDAADAVDAAAAAAVAAGVAVDLLPASSLPSLFPGSRLVLPRRAVGLWCGEGGGLLDPRAADAAAIAAASRAGATVWTDWSLAGWTDAGSHWRVREAWGEGGGRVAEAERIVLPAAAARDAFGVRLGPGAADAHVPWVVSTTRPPPLGPSVAVFCHGLAPDGPDAAPWRVVPTPGGGVAVAGAAPGSAEESPDASPALRAVAGALPSLAALSGTASTHTTLTTADGGPLVGWLPLAESGRALLLQPAAGGSAGVADGLVAAPPLAAIAAVLLSGAAARAEADLDPGRPAVGEVTVTPLDRDPWEAGAAGGGAAARQAAREAAEEAREDAWQRARDARD